MFTSDKVNLDQILEHGFVFSKVAFPPSLLYELKTLDFHPHTGLEKIYVKDEHHLDFDSPFSQRLRKLLLQCVDEEYMIDAINDMHFVVTRMGKGDKMGVHRDIEISHSALFHINIWLPETEYEGRDFVHGTHDRLTYFHPRWGDCVFINTISDEYVHAVSELQSDSIVYSIGACPSSPEELADANNTTAEHYGTLEEYISEFQRDKDPRVFIREH